MKIIYSSRIREEINKLENKYADCQIADLVIDNADYFIMIDDSPLSHFETGFDVADKIRGTDLNIYSGQLGTYTFFILASNGDEAVDKISKWHAK